MTKSILKRGLGAIAALALMAGAAGVAQARHAILIRLQVPPPFDGGHQYRTLEDRGDGDYMRAHLAASVYGLPNSLLSSELVVLQTPALLQYDARLSTRCSNGALIEDVQRPAAGRFVAQHACFGGSHTLRVEGVIDIR